MAEKKLLDTLDELKVDEFKRFKWLLHNYRPKKDVGAIKEFKLENADRQETLCLMVNYYDIDEALKVTKNVLKDIPRMDLVNELSKIGLGTEGQSQFSLTQDKPVPAPVLFSAHQNHHIWCSLNIRVTEDQHRHDVMLSYPHVD